MTASPPTDTLPQNTRTVEVPLSITCPPWCTVEPARHAQQLWDFGGECFHYSSEVSVPDPGRGPCCGRVEDARPSEPATVSFVATTNPLGRETASASFTIETPETMGVEQLEALLTAA